MVVLGFQCNQLNPVIPPNRNRSFVKNVFCSWICPRVIAQYNLPAHSILVEKNLC
ncbi:4Fe-4S binding protein [Candidatus Venteria ishoeyi]|uniref:4Fe-4S binding protein n=1 Tax=Candidatus Venteria ishoeyi TaxID=1899563 RepID=UPI00387E8785